MKSISESLFARELAGVNNLFDLFFSETEQHVFRFEISVDDSTDSVEEVKAHEDLSGDFLDIFEGKAFVVVPFEDF